MEAAPAGAPAAHLQAAPGARSPSRHTTAGSGGGGASSNSNSSTSNNNNNNNITPNHNNTPQEERHHQHQHPHHHSPAARLPTYIDPALLRHYSLPESARHQAAAILWQLCESHPQITFAPTLYPIIAIFLHKHDQEHTYQAVCRLLQRNHQAAAEKHQHHQQQQAARATRGGAHTQASAAASGGPPTPLLPTTRLEHVRDVLVLIKLCTKFGLLAPLLMRDFVRAERRFLANLEASSRQAALNRNRNSNSCASGQPHHQASDTCDTGQPKGSLLSTPIRRASRVARRLSKLGRRPSSATRTAAAATPSNHGNSPSHSTDINATQILNPNHCAPASNATNKHQQQHPESQTLFDTPFFDWYKWIFVALPLTYCVRIVDCWLVDGQKFLYRLTLAILSRFRQQNASRPIAWSSERMFEFCERLEASLERKGGVEQLIKEANSLKRISTLRIARERKKSESKANLIVGSIMRKDNHAFKLYNYGQTPNHINQPRSDMLSDIIISTRIAPRTLKSCIVDSYELLDDLWQYIPERAAVKNVSVVFNSNNDGTSLQTFFSRVDPYEESLMIIRTIKNQVFGAYCSSSWSQRKNQAQSASKKSFYFGNGETFLFTLQPMFSVYLWVGKTESDTHHQPHPAPLEPSAPTLPATNTPPRETPQHQNNNNNNNQVQPNELNKNHLENPTDSISTQLFMSATSQELIIGSGNGSFGLWLDADLTRGKTDHCRTFNNLPLCEDRDFTCKDVEVLAFS